MHSAHRELYISPVAFHLPLPTIQPSGMYGPKDICLDEQIQDHYRSTMVLTIGIITLKFPIELIETPYEAHHKVILSMNVAPIWSLSAWMWWFKSSIIL